GLSRSGALFADPLRASVKVLIDRNRVDPNRVGFTTRFEPYVRVGDAHVTRRDTGPVTQLVYSAELICLTNACLAKRSGNSVRLVGRAQGDAPDKRKALELLARELAHSGEPELALVARELAWGEPTPLPTVSQPLMLDVRRVIEQRSNGQVA